MIKNKRTRCIFVHSLTFVAVSYPAFCHSADFISTGTPTLTRIHTSENPITLVRDVTAFQLSVALSGSCQYLVIDPSDKNTLAHFLLAKASGKTITVYYSNSIPIPWGDPTSCYVEAIDTQ